MLLPAEEKLKHLALLLLENGEIVCVVAIALEEQLWLSGLKTFRIFVVVQCFRSPAVTMT